MKQKKFEINFFHLTKLERENNKIFDEIKKYLIVKTFPDKSIKWNWRLLYFTATVPKKK